MAKKLSRRQVLTGAVGGAVGVAASFLTRGATAAEPPNAPKLIPRAFAVGVSSDAGNATRGTASPSLLRSLADQKGITLGIDGDQFLVKPAVQPVLQTNFNALNQQFHMTAPWVSSPDQALHGTPDGFNFSWNDFAANWARTHGLRIFGSPLVWGVTLGTFTPNWVAQIATRAEAIAALSNYVGTVVGRYKSVETWTITNEPWHGGKSDIWRAKIGDDYPLVAAKAARDANPAAILILNDNDYHVPGPTADLNYSLATQMVSEGVLDGMGFQMHLQGAQPLPNMSDVARTLERFANLRSGTFSLHVTEFDVNLHGLAGTRDQRWGTQANFYYNMLTALVNAGGRHFFAFGNDDQLSWLNGLPSPWGGSDSEGTLFTPDLRPKPSYFAIREALLNFRPS
jgi:endo-1,4-beta-xylanase